MEMMAMKASGLERDIAGSIKLLESIKSIVFSPLIHFRGNPSRSCLSAGGPNHGRESVSPSCHGEHLKQAERRSDEHLDFAVIKVQAKMLAFSALNESPFALRDTRRAPRHRDAACLGSSIELCVGNLVRHSAKSDDLIDAVNYVSVAQVSVPIGAVDRLVSHAALLLGQLRVLDRGVHLEVRVGGSQCARQKGAHFRSRLCVNQRLADKNTITTTH